MGCQHCRCQPSCQWHVWNGNRLRDSSIVFNNCCRDGWGWGWVVRFCHRLVCAALGFHFCLRWLSSLLLKVAMFVFVRFLIALGRLLKIFGPWHLMVCFLVFWRWDGVLVRLKILHVLPLRWGISVCSWMHLFGSLLRLGVSSSRIFQMWIARYLALLSSKV